MSVFILLFGVLVEKKYEDSVRTKELFEIMHEANRCKCFEFFNVFNKLHCKICKIR